jgi:hypothetical protein
VPPILIRLPFIIFIFRRRVENSQNFSFFSGFDHFTGTKFFHPAILFPQKLYGNWDGTFTRGKMHLAPLPS